MTSKSLCFKLMKEDLKRRMWTIALTALGLVFTLVVPMALKSSSYMDRVRKGLDGNTRERLVKQLVDMVGINGLVITVLLAAAVVWAVSGFRYLHNSRKVDFYHSIPVKRHQLFLASYLNGILVPMAIYLTVQILSVALIVRTGIGIQTIGSTWWKAYLLNFVYYGMIYTTTVIAMMMTGNMIIALLGTVVFCGYGPAVVSLVMIYKSQWFYTYYATQAQQMAYLRAVNYTSPFAGYMFALEDFSQDGLVFQRMAGALLVTAALAVVAYGLYRIRPSESAGKAMAFKRTEGPIKHLIALPVGVVFGIFFFDLRNTLPWAVFGVVCGSALTCCMMEIIYHFDFRKLFHNWIHLLACSAISLLLVLAGMYDWFGYDSWLPDEGSLKSAVVLFDMDDDWVTYGNVKIETDQGGRQVARWDYAALDDYGFDHMDLTDVYTVMELGKKGVAADKERRSGGSEDFGWFAGRNCIVEFRLNSGKSVYRRYAIPEEDIKPLRTTIHDNREYKRGIYPILEQTASDTSSVYFQQYNQKVKLELTNDQISHLLAVYQKELEELPMAVRERELPIGTIQFRTMDLERGILVNEEIKYGYDLESRCFYPVYPSFARTLEDLEGAGVKFVKLDETTVSDVRIRYYWGPDGQYQEEFGDLVMEPEAAELWETDSDESGVVVYNQKEDLKALIPALVFGDYLNMNCYYDMEMPVNVDVYVTANLDASAAYSDRSGQTGGFRINMKKLSGDERKRFRLASEEDDVN